MPYTSSPTLTTPVRLDALARARCAQLVPIVAEGYAAQGGTGGPKGCKEVVDEAYVLTGAVRVGLNRWTLSENDIPDAEELFWRPSPGVEYREVDVEVEDLARATGLSNLLKLELEQVLSAACATGLAMMLGVTEICGPFRG
jgi:hypothetical protein